MSTGNWARFARSLADALQQLARDLENPQDLDQPAANSETLELPEVRGSRQQAIVTLAGLRTEEGMKASEIANKAKTDEYNVYASLDSLERQGVLERIPGSNPRRWRLAPRYRPSPPHTGEAA